VAATLRVEAMMIDRDAFIKIIDRHIADLLGESGKINEPARKASRRLMPSELLSLERLEGKRDALLGMVVEMMLWRGL